MVSLEINGTPSAVQATCQAASERLLRAIKVERKCGHRRPPAERLKSPLLTGGEPFIKKLEGTLAVDAVAALKEFDSQAICHSELCIEPADFANS